MNDSTRTARCQVRLTIFVLLCLPTLLYGQDFSPNELIVKFKDTISDSLFQSIGQKKNFSALLVSSAAVSVKKVSTVFSQKKQPRPNTAAALSTASSPIRRTLRVEFSDSPSNDDALRELAQNPLVDYVQRNYIYRVDQIPNDSAYSSQWSLERIGIFQLWASGFFDQPLPEVRVGVLDTGVDYLHPDLASRIYVNEGETGLDQFGRDKKTNGIDDDGNGFVDDWHGYDFVDSQVPDLGDWSTPDNDPMDENGHGTAVAGIIGAQANNSIGIAGISPIARIVPLRAFNAAGLGTDADIAAGIIYAADNGVQVINMSFGDVILTPLLRDVIHYAHGKNVLLIASSGNDGTSNPHYPSDFSDVVSVGSVSQDNVRSFFSSYGPALSLVAPGESIPTTKLGGGYQSSFSGTSAAAPHVSAVASILISLDEAKNSANPKFIPLSNEEIRATMLAACQDLGAQGWDNFYGAGLINARGLLSPENRNIVQIKTPLTDSRLEGASVVVIGTATTDQLDSVALFFGEGDSPSSWNTISSSRGKHFVNDTLGVWNLSFLSEGTYVLRLHVKNIQSSDVENRIRVFVAKSAAIVTNFSFQDSVIFQDQSGALASLRLNSMCSAKLLYRVHGSSGAYSEIASPGIQLDHSFLISKKEFVPGAEYDFYFIATDQSGNTFRFPTTTLVGFEFYTFTFTSRDIPTTGFTELPLSLPSGFLLNRVDTISTKSTIILNEYDDSGNFGKLKAFQYVNGSFVPVDSAERHWVPRDIRDVFHDGRLSTLVQDHGVTKLFSSNAAGNSFFSSMTFVDSADVWGSQMYDFDGDGKLDLVARNSSQYLVYRNLGENNFQLMARLDNPTKPLPGDAVNQFGPPKSLVGDFSGTGNAEIIFADYDGDVLLYRQVNKQTAPFQFQLAWVDSSDLFETSDYLAAGDFNGDGRQDFAVMGHSNLDLNSDREYDTPIWRVRIFSHRASDALNIYSKLWEQTFYGVKAGFSYDNGISSGKILSTSNDQVILSLNPYLYVFDYDSTLKTFNPRWVHTSTSNGIIVSDFNNNGMMEFGFNSEGKTRFFERTSTAVKPQAPWALTLLPIAPRTIKVGWSSSAPLASHKIYRDTIPQPQALLATVAGTSYLDTTVLLNKKYWYAVSLIGSSESDRSLSVFTIPHTQALIDSIITSSFSQLTVAMSFPIDPNRLSSALVVIDDSIKPTSLILRQPSKLLLTLGTQIAKDTHYVHISNLIDLYGMQADTTQRVKFLMPVEQTTTFYLRQAALASQTAIAIEFSDSLSASASDVSNYTFSNTLKKYSLKKALIDTLSRRKVVLSLSDGEHLGPIGFRMELHASENIQNNKGEPLNGGKGQTASIVIDISTLDDLLVFPNPLRYSSSDGGRDHITFANLPEHCRIDIFEPQGKKVVTLEGNTRADGIRWNLIDDHGRGVGSGIYIFYATQLDDNGNETQTKKGKFAIVR